MEKDAIIDIVEATVRALNEHRRLRSAEQQRGCAIIMRAEQHKEFCQSPAFDGFPSPPGMAPRITEIGHLPIYLHHGTIGPCVVDSSTLLFLRFCGAVKVG